MSAGPRQGPRVCNGAAWLVEQTEREEQMAIAEAVKHVQLVRDAVTLQSARALALAGDWTFSNAKEVIRG